ncbi:MAG: tetratricopeptide repeat protein [Stagnimonas sp.]|nr:tetratricopeptide repeat protein [Stagnimonas sp.]
MPIALGLAGWRYGLLLAALLTLGLYSLGLSGPFLFDDRSSIVLNPAVQPEHLDAQSLAAAWSGNRSGPLGRPIASLSFALDFALAGELKPYGYKVTNTVLHVLCGMALFGFLNALLRAGSLAGTLPDSLRSRARAVAALATALWLLHPLHVSTVLYVVQRMAVLAALFGFLGLWAYANGRYRQLQGQSGWTGILLAMPLMTVAAALSKENGLLTPLLCLVCEACFFRLQAQTQGIRRALRGGALLLIALAGSAAILWGSAIWSAVLNGFADRPFDLQTRLLTEARVLCWYLQLLVVPNLAEMNLYHDDIPLSTAFDTPPITMLALAALAAMVASALIFRKRAALYSFAVLFFFVGHLLESSVVALELVFEHRNYAPSAGLALLAAGLIFQLAASRRRLAAGLAVAMLLLFSILLAERSRLFSDDFLLLKHSLQYHPRSVRTQLWAGDVYKLMAERAAPRDVARLRDLANGHYLRAAALDPSETIGLFEVLIRSYQQGQPPDQAHRDELFRRLREEPPHAGTIVATDDFVRSILRDELAVPEGEGLATVNALLANPRLRGDRRGTVLADRANLLWRAGEHDLALASMAEAQQLRPWDAYLALNRAVSLLQLGRLDEAETLLALAKRLDRGELNEGLELLSRELREARRQP